MPLTNREILARMINCEAGGEGDTGMRAVATVILNRVNVAEGEYSRISNGGNIRNILFQEGQFDCARTSIRGMYNAQNIYNIPAEPIHYEIADWALAGNKINEVGDCLWYLNPFRPTCSPQFPNNGSRNLSYQNCTTLFL